MVLIQTQLLVVSINTKHVITKHDSYLFMSHASLQSYYNVRCEAPAIRILDNAIVVFTFLDLLHCVV